MSPEKDLVMSPLMMRGRKEVDASLKAIENLVVTGVPWLHHGWLLFDAISAAATGEDVADEGAGT